MIREASANEPPCERIEIAQMTSKPGLPGFSGMSMAATYLLAMRCPVYRRCDSNLGSGRGTWNLWGDGKGKGTSGGPARPKVPMRHSRGGLLRSSGEAG